MIRLIITDIGGVLIKTDEAIISCIEQVFTQKNIAFGSRERLLEAFGVSIYDYIKNYLPPEQMERADECYAAFKQLYPSQARDKMKVFAGVNSSLQTLSKTCNIAILSCMVRDEVQANLSLLDFADFCCVLSLEDYGHKRPLPNGLLMIIDKVGVSNLETLYIGDTVNDIRMAKNAGVISVAVRTGAQSNKQLEQEVPDYLLDSFADLPELIETLNSNR